ncbi:hypothetical protein [Streptomyces sp. IBSBF 2394]|uniref:hypothetical protein n=1 Tax=Streptomyces sp. IBSBF 2394 TaxID=2903532 RepID=UPI003FA7968A
MQWQTGPVVWGTPGTNGQHAYYQLIPPGHEADPGGLHRLRAARGRAERRTQGPARPADSQLLRPDPGPRPRQDPDEVRAEGVPEELVPHKTFRGNHPTTTILARELTPSVLGQLIALYEHKVFAQGAIWNIGSFDQWGVELGKVLAKRAEPALTEDADIPGLDASTRALVTVYRDLKEVH